MENLFKKIPGFATYIIIGFGSVCILSCCYNIINKICRRREDNTRIFQELEIMGGQVEEVPKSKKIIQTVVEEVTNDVKKRATVFTTVDHKIEEDELPPAPPPSPVVKSEKECKYNITRPSNKVRDKYIDALISEYLVMTEQKLSAIDIRKKYNYFRTSQDIANFKIDMMT